MKSTPRYKKRALFSIFLAGIFTFLNVNESQAGYGVKFHDGVLKLALEIDDHKVVKLLGLPLKGHYYYHASKAALIFQPDGEDFAYQINITPLERQLPKARVSRKKKHDKMLMGFDTEFWQLQTEDYDCKEVHGSSKLGKKVGMNMTDFARINLGLSHLMGEGIKQPCESHVVSKALGGLIGFPLEVYSPANKTYFEVTKIVDDASLVKHKLPADIRKFDDSAYAAFLETMLTDSAYHSYMQTRGVLGDSGITKVKALKRLLVDPNNRRNLYSDFGDKMPIQDKKRQLN